MVTMRRGVRMTLRLMFARVFVQVERVFRIENPHRYACYTERRDMVHFVTESHFLYRPRNCVIGVCLVAHGDDKDYIDNH